MRVTVTSELISTEHDGRDTTDPEFFVSYVAGAEPYIVPGVTSWDNVTAEVTGQRVVISADLTTLPDVPSGDQGGNAGEPVNEDWISKYILGADAYWLAPEVLMPTKVTFA
jgi:hypothetical protein